MHPTLSTYQSESFWSIALITFASAEPWADEITRLARYKWGRIGPWYLFSDNHGGLSFFILWNSAW